RNGGDAGPDAPRRRPPGDVLPVEPDAAGTRTHHTENRLHGGRLARSVPTQQRDDSAEPDFERDVDQRGTGAVVHAHVPELQQCAHRVPSAKALPRYASTTR